MSVFTGKQRMLNAYRGVFSDRVAVAPEFWFYYPAKVMGVDMIAFGREVPFHLALKKTFETFGCEGWGVAFGGPPNPQVSGVSTDRWVDAETLETRHLTRTPFGELTSVSRGTRDEPAWSIERPVKDFARDLPAWECVALGGNPEDLDPAGLLKARAEVGESYLLEAWLSVPFFDFLAGALDGGFEAGILLFSDPAMEPTLERLRERHTDYLVRLARAICTKTPYESLCIGCSWSCNSLLGPHLWRRWDKPGIRAVADEIHRHGRLLHVHFHGRCFETVADFAEIGLDCVCPFERPPGGDVVGREGLDTVARLLRGRTTVNGNVHTVETLIRGRPADARREVGEILGAFAGNPRIIVGTGDQVGRETPAENLHAMVDEAVRLSPAWRRG
ncbi:MAG: methylcobalamin:coenzyme M methyltransferase [Lentisphaerae bacterium ADurb.BinA184]|nr:MAG: methylcobalamin:coenzyme M methyltransferase [Lentisphaerae bacterium ADurb.BinA184]